MTPFKNSAPIQKVYELVTVAMNNALKMNSNMSRLERSAVCNAVCDKISQEIQRIEVKCKGDNNASE